MNTAVTKTRRQGVAVDDIAATRRDERERCFRIALEEIYIKRHHNGRSDLEIAAYDSACRFIADAICDPWRK